MPDTSSEIQSYLDRPLDELVQELAIYREQAAGPMRGPAGAWEKIAPILRQRVCVEGSWCERRQDARFDDPTNIILALASMIDADAVRLAVPAALVAVILFKRGLDRFCDCPPIGVKGTAASFDSTAFRSGCVRAV